MQARTTGSSMVRLSDSSLILEEFLSVGLKKRKSSSVKDPKKTRGYRIILAPRLSYSGKIEEGRRRVEV
ncbi:hypothetical protein BCR33DRAFT_722524 [Rhizoclosmatium globosum]|uniref:Uncharacterized protein n=1 Tax=Rhizoclosmatium globosum TaxID=329046 RepID=A0A1Y2BK84_9FUNG|nr:hypothetical protein BCR33DRAFT_722524 [Rhizoclosmatium globosum]|eukprot:ORY35174.1 hypothetical protein BCR33DRAFT_722524 [Rhizoclosmatium globosum]